MVQDYRRLARMFKGYEMNCRASCATIPKRNQCELLALTFAWETGAFTWTASFSRTFANAFFFTFAWIAMAF